MSGFSTCKLFVSYFPEHLWCLWLFQLLCNTLPGPQQETDMWVWSMLAPRVFGVNSLQLLHCHRLLSLCGNIILSLSFHLSRSCVICLCLDEVKWLRNLNNFCEWNHWKHFFLQVYVSDYNIFFKSDVNAEAVQVTHNGKKNEILNGIPDWVYEGKFNHSEMVIGCECYNHSQHMFLCVKTLVHYWTVQNIPLDQTRTVMTFSNENPPGLLRSIIDYLID